MGQASTGLMVVGLAAVIGAGYYMYQQQQQAGGGTLPPGQGELPPGRSGTTTPPGPTVNEVSNLDVFYAQP